MSEQENRDAVQETTGSSSEPKKAKAEKKAEQKKPGRVSRWLKDLKGELKKVTWPSGKDVIRNVGVVIASVIIVGAFIWVFDFLARQVVDALLNLFA